MSTTRDGPLGLLRDLQDLSTLAHPVDITWTMVNQVAFVHVEWIKTQMSQAAPQALIVAR